MRVFVKVLSTLLITSLLFISCEDTLDDEDGDQNAATQLYTEDINVAPQFLDLESASYVNKDYDLSFQLGGMTYSINQNSSAGVLAFATDTISFDTNELPAVGYSPDSSELVIGDSWVDISTYNPADHSVSSNSMIYFIRSTDYKWLKFRVVNASPTVFTVEYAEYTENVGYGDVISKSISYSSSAPALFSFQAGEAVEPAVWDVVLATAPEYSTELSTNFYMPTIMFNSDEGVKVGIIEDTDINEVSGVPSGITWITDTSSSHPFGNGGMYQVLVYHPEPPYNHKVIVEHPDRVYIIEAPSGTYKVQFEDYSSGVILFSYAIL